MELLKKLIDSYHQINAKRELSRAAKKISPLLESGRSEDFIEMVFGEQFGKFFWIKQVRSEITGFCNLIETVRPQTILEIGTAAGGSLFLSARHSHPQAHIISLDLPDGNFGGGYPEYRSDFYKSFAGNSQTVTLIRGDSHQDTMLEKVKILLNDRTIDLLFIDGDHSYEGVTKDFEMYSPLVSPKGLIAFHDIVKHKEGWNCGVDQFWGEVKTKYSHIEFVENPLQQWAGIGVLFKKSE